MPNLPYSPDTDWSKLFRETGAALLAQLGALLARLNAERDPFLFCSPTMSSAEAVSEVMRFQEKVVRFFASHTGAAMRKHVMRRSGKGVDARTCRIVGYLVYYNVHHSLWHLQLMRLAQVVALSGDPAEVLENRRAIAALASHGLIQIEPTQHRCHPFVRLGDRVLLDSLGGARCIPAPDKNTLLGIASERRRRANLRAGRRISYASPQNLAACSSIAPFLESIPFPSPRELFDSLEELGYIGQEQARKAVALAAYRHVDRLRRIHLHGVPRAQLPPVQNVLCIGPTGCGKTFMMRLLFSEILKMPTVILDSTVYSETGYVGGDVSSIPTHLLQAAKGDLDVAQASICVLDEFDKLAESGGGAQTRVSRHGVQRSLLKLLEPGVVDCPAELSAAPWRSRRIQFQTDDVLWIACGAFSGLHDEDSVTTIGFGEESVYCNSSQLKVRTFESYGILPELVGRFPGWVRLDRLSHNDLKEIVRRNTVSHYATEFAGHGVELVVEDPALELVATRSVDRGTGARGLQAELVDALEDIAFEVYSSKSKPRAVIISARRDEISWSLERSRRSQTRQQAAADNKKEAEHAHV